MQTIEETKTELTPFRDAFCALPIQESGSIGKQSAYIVMTAGYWGRGVNPQTAAKQAKESGARSDMSAMLLLVIGDDKPEINDYGHTLYSADAVVIRIGIFKSLRVLLNHVED